MRDKAPKYQDLFLKSFLKQSSRKGDKKSVYGAAKTKNKQTQPNNKVLFLLCDKQNTKSGQDKGNKYIFRKHLFLHFWNFPTFKISWKQKQRKLAQFLELFYGNKKG